MFYLELVGNKTNIVLLISYYFVEENGKEVVIVNELNLNQVEEVITVVKITINVVMIKVD